MRGNVIDLAVGVVIGGAFGKIVTSLVDNIIMPPIGFITGGVDFSNLKLILKPADVATKTAEVAIFLWRLHQYHHPVPDHRHRHLPGGQGHQPSDAAPARRRSGAAGPHRRKSCWPPFWPN